MARPKKKREVAKNTSSDSKAVFQVRLASEVHEKLKSAAAEAGISMNQLIQGVLRWAGNNVRQGRPTLNGQTVGEEPASECVWFGKLTRPYGFGTPGHAGQFVFKLDFSDRNALDTELIEIDQVGESEFEARENYIRDGDPSWDFPARQDAMMKRRQKLIEAGMDPNDTLTFFEAEKAFLRDGNKKHDL